MKIIFLDIDGVLNSERSVEAQYDDKFKHNVYGPAYFDPLAIKLIEKLVIETDSKIVISSSWRIGRVIADFDFLPQVVGLTTTQHLGIRGHQIQHYIDDNEIERYVIIDDDSDMLEHQKDFFVHVNGMNGFSVENFYDARSILKGN